MSTSPTDRIAGTGEGTRHLALQIYFWGDSEQRRLLADFVHPTFSAYRDPDVLRRFWVYRFDARGPHVLVLFGVGDAAADGVVRGVTRRLDRYLRDAPSRAALSPEEMAARHEACRGATLTVLDGEPGMAANNTYALLDHPADSDPFGPACQAETERLFAELAFWSLGTLGASPAAAACSWLAALDGALARAGTDPRPVWRYYASTLFPSLRTQILAEDPATVQRLAGRIGEGNAERIRGMWSPADAQAPVLAERAARIGLAQNGAEAPRFAFIRNLNHAVLGQLGIPVMLRIPLVLYAWLHDRASHLPSTAGIPA